MNTYVMSDIHGCYDDFLRMLDKIAFSESDSLILAGDYIDRGKRSFDMLKWVENAPSNVLFLRGNHEEEFASYVDLMLRLNREAKLETDFDSNEDAAALYGSVKYLLKNKALPVSYFDL